MGTHAPTGQTLRDVDYGGIPGEGGTPPPQPREMDETCGVGTVHVGARKYPYISGMDNPDPITQG